MDRCALFVDAGYVLADGAMAVHGTRRRESVSWDYAGLTHFLSGLASERSGLPLLRCYWYEATVEGRRTEEHDALADLPGVKLRLAKMRPGRREGVESEIHRDLTTLARNKAVTDAMVVSAEEDLAQVVADVQDLGMRVTLLHIAVDGNGEIPRALRQECDDIAEINGAHLRPYVELISGAEPPRTDEQDGGSLIVFRPAANGHGQPAGAAPYAPAPQETDNGYRMPPVYEEQADTLANAPEPPAAHLDLAPAVQDVQQDGQPVQPQPVHQEPAQQEVAAELDQPAAPVEPAAPAAEYFGAPPGLAVVQPEQGQGQPSPSSPADPQEYAVRPDWPAGPEFTPRPEVYGAPVAVPAPPVEQPVVLPAARNRATDLSGYRPGAIRMQPPRDPVSREPLPAEPGGGYQPAPASAQVHRLPSRGAGQPATAPPPLGGPGAPGAPGAAMPPPPAGQPMPGQPSQGQPLQGQPGIGQPAASPFAAPPEAGRFSAPQPEEAGPFTAPQQEPGQPPLPGQPSAAPYGASAPVTPMVPDVGYPAHDAGHSAPRNGSYTGPRPVAPLGSGGGAPAAPWGQPPAGGPNGPSAPSGPIGPGVPGAPVGLGGHQGQPAANPLATPSVITPQADPDGQPGPGSGVLGGPLGPAGPAYSAAQPGVSLADAVQSAHREGQEFGESVAHDAPALWLEAVLARKPRMPSDLEARLLQGSALPIDFLLHDEVRHALRRGFWDALERSRR
ncbi:MAG TPA: NYN domain-containing protein [Streptosporangiaceae bacterium]|nr:NYN domain-containing protein [Streptosporangiaceae bacterium]